jgi:aspartyl protease family protein
LIFSNNRSTQVETAGGKVGSQLVTLDTVSVGGIAVRNVQAVVIDGVYPVDILLGMSFLRNVDIKESSGVMQLKGNF